MIIHSYLTDGFYGWAEIFVKSFRHHHGDDHKIILSTRDLNKHQIARLKTFYPKLQVNNKDLNLERIAKRAKISVEEIKKLKDHIENNAVTKKTFIWKQAISVEDRYKTSIIETMRHNPREKILVHFDIDMYFRDNLNELFDIIRKNDISIRFRKKSQMNRKVMGGLIGFRINRKTNEFMKRWIYHINKLPLYQKPLGYGQTSFYLAYLDLQKKLKWGDIPAKYISPRFLETDVIWSGNTKDGKAKNLSKCQKDFRKLVRDDNVNR